MQNLKDKNEELQLKLLQMKQAHKILNEELEIYRKNIKQYDQEKQSLMAEKNKLKQECRDKKKIEFEKKIKTIIERLPCQIEIKSLRQISNSTFQTARAAIRDMALAYRDAYKEEYHSRQSGKNQSLFESFYIIGVKHKQLDDETQSCNLKPKILYKQYKYDIPVEERKALESIQSDIEMMFQNNLLKVENLHNDLRIKEKILKFLDPINEIDLMNNQFFINQRGFDHIFDHFIPLNMKLITEINNQKQIFLFVLGVDDFMISVKEERFRFWKVKKFYCFLTYFPVFEIFEKALQFVGNIIQASRINLCKQLKERQNLQIQEIQFKQKIYQDNDSLNIIHTAKDKIQSYISDLSKQYLSFDKSKLDFQFQIKIQEDQMLEQQLTYSVTNDIKIKNMLKVTNVVMQFFCNFQLDFFNIFTEILKEGQIIFCCQNNNILVQVCYFFHQIVYPFIYTQPVLYYTEIEVVDQILIQELPFIVGINNSYDQLIKDLQRYNPESLQSNTLTIVELCNNMKVIIHQFPPRDPLKIKQMFSDNQFQDIFQNYTSVSLKLQAHKCQNLLSTIKSKIENDVILQFTQDEAKDFVINGILNFTYIKHCMRQKLSDNYNKSFIKDYAFNSSYLESYIRHKYK